MKYGQVILYGLSKTEIMMTKSELYKEILNLAPYHSEESDFRATLSRSLRTYLGLLKNLNEVEQPKGWNSIIIQVSKQIDKIKVLVSNSYKGLPSTAYTQLANILKKYDGVLKSVSIPQNTKFYRMRLIDGRRTGIKYSEMFHIPINKRGIVKTQRFSTPGFPCLYMGNSIYGCWEEMGRPIMNNCWVSMLRAEKEFDLLDLRIPSENDFINNFTDIIQLFPLIIASMIPVKNSEDVYKPEYILPQLLIEWIIRNKKNGIYYTSAHKNIDFDYPSEKFDNVAMPVKGTLKNVSNCPQLASLFKITNPLNNEIEQLKKGYGIDWKILGAKDKFVENYRISDFYNLEERLINEDLYDLYR